MGNSYQGPLETILFSFNTKELNSFMFQKKRKNTNIYINSPPEHNFNIYHHHLMTERQSKKDKQNKIEKKKGPRKGEKYIL